MSIDNQKLKGLIKGWKNEINKLKETKTKSNLSNLKIATIIETIDRCINDIEILILLEDYI